MRSYQVNITAHIAVTLRMADKPDEQEAMFRFLNDMMTDVSLDFQDLAQARLETAREQAAKAGIILDLPKLPSPMGVGFGISDVTGSVGKKWNPNS